jgi:uncharacterized membrane protein
MKNQKSPKDQSESSQKFAEGLCFRKLFFIFLIASVIGTIYEDLLIFVRTFLETGVGVWMMHRGVIYGPFNVIYGFGAALMCWLLLRKPYKNWQIFLYSALMGGAVEYLLSLGQELVIGTRSWDYSNQILDINGRTTLPIMLIWGAMGLVFMKIVYPWVSSLIEKIPPAVGENLFIVLLIFMIFNMVVSWSALIRQNLRHHEIRPLTPIGEFYDRYYTDEFLRKYYTNMERRQ